MMQINERQQKVIAMLLRQGKLRSSEIHSALQLSGADMSLVTVKRLLSEMAQNGLISVQGEGPATAYSVSSTGRLFADIDAHTYCREEPDKRFGQSSYNFNLLASISEELFLKSERASIDNATTVYIERTRDLPRAIHKKELERLIIELSWKSSKIEGNTYTLLDTEKLILKNEPAQGHSREETQMILNHKDAFTFVHDHRDVFRNVTRINIEKLHTLLVKDMDVSLDFRKTPVGILGSKYQPLDNQYQIGEALDELIRITKRINDPFTIALVALLGVSYIQPFEDGNKRTSRIIANAILLAHGMAPLSYRSVDENEYREAMLVFYEVNSLVPFKRIFLAQYDFAARNYAVK